jgi:predicted MFS family arabinose efflux permease
MADGARAVRHTGAFSVPEFRAIWVAYAQSIVGDQLARVALSILVFDRTGSAGWTAATYALTYLPALLSGALLSGLADRHPRRSVMVGADVVRAALVMMMALPVVPLPVLAALLVLAQLADGPFGAARGAMLPAVLGSRYEHGQRVMLMTYQAGQVAGFGGGGVLVAWLGPHRSLAVDGLTFAASAIVIRVGVRHRPAALSMAGALLSPLAQVRDAARLILADARLRSLVGLGWLAGFTIVAEGLAAPFVAQVGGGTASVGAMLAAKPAGTILGAYLLGRTWIGLRRRLTWLGPLAVGTSFPLTLYLTGPDLRGAILLLLLSGLCAAYQITAGAAFVQLAPDSQRGQALGLARSGLTAVQGVGIAVGGLVAQLSGTPAGTIGAAGVAGTLCAAGAALAWSRAKPHHVAEAFAHA